MKERWKTLLFRDKVLKQRGKERFRLHLSARQKRKETEEKE